jgi:TonB-dependent SusC/RagA subfamily outer membrane receptor
MSAKSSATFSARLANADTTYPSSKKKGKNVVPPVPPPPPVPPVAPVPAVPPVAPAPPPPPLPPAREGNTIRINAAPAGTPSPQPATITVTGYRTGTSSGSLGKSNLTYRRDANGAPAPGTPVYYVDGVSRGHSDPGVKSEDIQNITVLSSPDAATYGEEGKSGVILIDTKEYMAKNKVHQVNVGTNSVVVPNGNPLYVVEGKVVSNDELKKYSASEIEAMSVLKGDAATSKYGKDGANGVIEIKLKSK